MLIVELFQYFFWHLVEKSMFTQNNIEPYWSTFAGFIAIKFFISFLLGVSAVAGCAVKAWGGDGVEYCVDPFANQRK